MPWMDDEINAQFNSWWNFELPDPILQLLALYLSETEEIEVLVW